MVEYIPMRKSKSVPDDATAYQRIPYPNVVNIIRWKDNTPENVKWAQMSSCKVMGIIPDRNEELSGGPNVEGYRSYGEYSGQASTNGGIEVEWRADSDVDGGDGLPVSDKAAVLFGSNYSRLQKLKKI
jgi:hypothetical protein